MSLVDANHAIASAINRLPQLSLKIVSDASTADLYRAIRNHLPSLIPGLLPQDISTMSLGLSHSLSRHKLKFSPDKVDTMIVQAIALLDDLDKELNTYAMRVKEWYGWHFPEMGRIVNDNLAYARVILKMGMRSNASNADLADILPEEIEAAVKSAAEISMGTEITTEDMDNIQALAEQVASFTEYRSQLSTYLSNRMSAIAPNLTTLVGDLVGARLIAHAGSLMNLAKSPASTIQILGAEKALFRALKTKHDTPKYGLIYHASLIGQATGKNKGKVARILATKAALGLRVDALHEWGQDGEDPIPDDERNAVGLEGRMKVERRLASLEGRPVRSTGVAIGPNGVSAGPGKWEVKEARKYNPDADGLVGDEPAALAPRIKSSQDSKKDDMLFKASQDSQKNKKLIEEIDEHAASGSEDSSEAEAGAEDAETKDDVDMEDDTGAKDEPASQIEALAATESINKANGHIEKAAANGDEKSETISTVSDDSPDSPDSPTPQEINWQSSILGNTKVAKKARKKERHERKLALSAERSETRGKKNAKLARRLDRKERRLKRAEQLERREAGEDEKYREPAAEAGLSIERYKRKLERGEIKFEDGKPVSISKKDLKKARKAAEKAEEKKVEKIHEDGSNKKKRKREDDVEGVEKSEKKKKKKKSKA
jgi:nucleolar protein 58